MTPTIVVVGSTNMHLLARTAHLPVPGETVLGDFFTTSPGGKGSNQAIAAARAGGVVTFIGAVGDDDFAANLTATLDEAGVIITGVRHVPGPSGVALISVDENAENSIIVVPGANAALTELTAADRSAIAAAAVLVMQLEVPLETVSQAAQIAAAAGTSVMLNPSPIQQLPSDLVHNVSVLVANEAEAAALGDTVMARVPHVVTTLGARGATYRGPGGDVLTVRAPLVDAVDTTGAGDAFTGALAVAWATRQAPQQALEFACAAGALATTRVGAVASAPSQAAIATLVAETYGS